MENYEEISKTDSILSQYSNYRISHKNQISLNIFSVPLTQLLIAAFLATAILLFRFIPVFEPAFNVVKNFMQKDIFENLNAYIKSVF